MELIISLLCGSVGGNLGGMLLKKFSLGTLGNSIVGILGGGIGSQLLRGVLGSGIGGQIASGTIGGIVVMIVIGLIKKALGK